MRPATASEAPVPRRPDLLNRPILKIALFAALALCLIPADSALAKEKCDRDSKGITPIWRVDSPDDVQDWKSISRHIEQRDIFLINTRQDGLRVPFWTKTATRLKRAFPCNRIMTLNGLHHDPGERGYYAALTDFEDLWGAALDFEQMDWTLAKKIGARGIGPPVTNWVPDNIPLTTERFRRAVENLAKKSKAPVIGAFPAAHEGWDHGVLDKVMMDAAPGKGTLYSLQTQVPCEIGQATFEARVNMLRDQHRAAGLTFHQMKGFGTSRFVGLQISFTHQPIELDPSITYPLPMLTMPVAQAIRCTKWAKLSSRQTILYWTEPESARAFFARPKTACALRRRCG